MKADEEREGPPEPQGPPELHRPEPGAPDGENDEPSQKKRGWLWLLAGLAVLALGAAVFWFLSRPEDREAKPPPQPPLVRSALAERADRLTIRQTGFVRADESVEVAAEIGGRIVEVGDTFRTGAFVQDGALLIRLDTGRIEADIASAEAGVEQAEAALAEARIARERQEQLEEREFASEARLQQAIVKVAIAEADLTAAEAALTQARDRRDQAIVTAPFDAFVTEQSAAPGALVQPGVPVGTLVSAGGAEIEMGLTPPDLDVLGQAERAIGGQVILRAPDAPDGVLAYGEVTAVDPDIAPQTRTVGLIVTVRDPFSRDRAGSRPLRVGELVALELPVSLENRNIVSVPPEAVKGRGTIWVIEDGVLDRRDVRPLQRGETRVLIAAEALPAGARVMLSDLPDAVAGQRVRLETVQNEGKPEPVR
ncbi:efflux RND transporter periplasmic adaptor subunit [Marivita sp. GX14005]|uniref:efflux RND transporter periplasmic adaptor subunit n=1 Tax=Marivita sp. GX14005 TaxID=2942276 RepID=UPI002018A5B3|nr:efflux RND transporter periplasmic adaptor subunit [Marivita sp. GX14005]MCL3881213.1 efflux RND transporter periplasmic adaptor subunit [Marivita sp. GX14005]